MMEGVGKYIQNCVKCFSFLLGIMSRIAASHQSLLLLDSKLVSPLAMNQTQ